MNFAKVSVVLYPILGENGSDIVLSYMIPDLYKHTGRRNNMYEFFDRNELDMTKLDETFEALKEIYDEDGKFEEFRRSVHRTECNQSWMTNTECKSCDKIHDYSYNYDICGLIMIASNFPDWVDLDDRAHENLTRDIREGMQDNLIEAFLKDYKMEDHTVKDYETDDCTLEITNDE